jgi:hypothetical protein
MSRRRNAISEQFVPRMVSMPASPAFRVLSRPAHLVLARIEMEHMNHGGGRTAIYQLPTKTSWHMASIVMPSLPPSANWRRSGLSKLHNAGAPGTGSSVHPAYIDSPTATPNTRRVTAPTNGDGFSRWSRRMRLRKARAAIPMRPTFRSSDENELRSEEKTKIQ